MQELDQYSGSRKKISKQSNSIVESRKLRYCKTHGMTSILINNIKSSKCALKITSAPAICNGLDCTPH